jgi:hypothetical protein
LYTVYMLLSETYDNYSVANQVDLVGIFLMLDFVGRLSFIHPHPQDYDHHRVWVDLVKTQMLLGL